MHYSPVPSLLFLLLFTYIPYRLLATYLLSRRRSIRARELGCAEPAFEPYRWPGGIDTLRGYIAADAGRRFPIYATQRFKDVGADTYKLRILGKREFHHVVVVKRGGKM